MKKVVIITGANGNLGKAVVQKYLNESYNVIGFVHHPSTDSPQPNYEEVAVNLLDEYACKQAIDKVIAQYNTIDVAILTAGGFTMGNISSTSLSNMNQQYQLNFATAYNIAQPVFCQMVQQQYGKIFFIGSKAGADMHQAKGVVAYALSKSLLFNLSTLLNQEANNTDIKSTVIVPTIIDTPQNRADMPNADFSKWTKPEDIANTIYNLSNNNEANNHEAIVYV